VNQSLHDRVLEWIEGDPDIEDRETLQRLLESGTKKNSPSIRHAINFWHRGTSRAGDGRARRNESLQTVRRATQGVIAWLDEIGVDAGRGSSWDATV